MSRTLVLIGTRKGCFVLESDADRRDWSLRGPFCESWPVYHAVYDQGSGTIFAAAASEWHGSAIWRSTDLGETWEHSSRGPRLRGRPAVSRRSRRSPPATTGCSSASRRPGSSRAATAAQTFSLLSTLAGEPGSEGWDDPANQPPGHLGISGDRAAPGRPVAVLRDRAGGRPLGDDRRRQQRGRRATAVSGPTGPASTRRSASACTSSSRADDQRMFQQNHVGMHRTDDGGALVDRDHRRASRREFGFGAAVQPARPRHVPRDPARPGPRPDDARRRGGGLDARTTPARAGSGPTRASRRTAPTSASCAQGLTNDTYDVPGLLLRHEHRPGVRERRRGRELAARSRATCRRSRPCESRP